MTSGDFILTCVCHEHEGEALDPYIPPQAGSDEFLGVLRDSLDANGCLV